MPRIQKPNDQKVQVSIKIRYLEEAYAVGAPDIGSYIEALKQRITDLSIDK